MAIYNKAEMAAALEEKVNAFNSYVAVMNKEKFETMPDGKWSNGQNLDHLIRSIKPLQPAVSFAKHHF